MSPTTIPRPAARTRSSTTSSPRWRRTPASCGAATVIGCWCCTDAGWPLSRSLRAAPSCDPGPRRPFSTVTPRLRWVSRLGRSYTLPGLGVAVVFACLSFTPSLLPRPALFQGLVTGIDAAIGYGFGVLGAWVWREFADRGPREPEARSWRLLAAVGGAALVVALVAGQVWQRRAHELVDTEPQ